MIIKPIPSIKGALANELGQIKLPECEAAMPNGVIRKYKTSWIYGTISKASRTARHKYYKIAYRGKNYKIHRLVCEAFHGKTPVDKPIVIHIDEDATNNAPDNLRWGTQKENLNMPNFIKYCKGRVGSNSPTIKGRVEKAKKTPAAF
tara:strand:- start:6 stop:446 length:441 start_codon:yes stop_codon:yes gene_type:complete